MLIILDQRYAQVTDKGLWQESLLLAEVIEKDFMKKEVVLGYVFKDKKDIDRLHRGRHKAKGIA